MQLFCHILTIVASFGDTCDNYLVEKLQKMQNRASRVITGKSYEFRSIAIIRELNWQLLVERREDNKAVFMYKIRKGEYLENISNLFKVANNQTYRLRNNNFDYALDKPKTNFLKKSISYSGAKTWNDLPRSFKATNIPLGHFRVLLKDRWTSA